MKWWAVLLSACLVMAAMEDLVYRAGEIYRSLQVLANRHLVTAEQAYQHYKKKAAELAKKALDKTKNHVTAIKEGKLMEKIKNRARGAAGTEDEKKEKEMPEVL